MCISGMTNISQFRCISNEYTHNILYFIIIQANLTELKSFGKPPPAVVNVTAAVMVLLAPASKIPKDRSWNGAKIMMAKVSTYVHCCFISLQCDRIFVFIIPLL